MSKTKTPRDMTTSAWRQKLERQADLLEAQASTARLMAMAETDLDGAAVACDVLRAAHHAEATRRARATGGRPPQRRRHPSRPLVTCSPRPSASRLTPTSPEAVSRTRPATPAATALAAPTTTSARRRRSRTRRPASRGSMSSTSSTTATTGRPTRLSRRGGVCSTRPMSATPSSTAFSASPLPE